jgi:hypothetical protein
LISSITDGRLMNNKDQLLNSMIRFGPQRKTELLRITRKAQAEKSGEKFSGEFTIDASDKSDVRVQIDSKYETDLAFLLPSEAV